MCAGYVAGRYRDGSWSDHWTDVTRCAEATFTAYRPACRCGWSGRRFVVDAVGHAAAVQALLDHVQPIPCQRRPEQPLPGLIRA